MAFQRSCEASREYKRSYGTVAPDIHLTRVYLSIDPTKYSYEVKLRTALLRADNILTLNQMQ